MAQLAIIEGVCDEALECEKIVRDIERRELVGMNEDCAKYEALGGGLRCIRYNGRKEDGYDETGKKMRLILTSCIFFISLTKCIEQQQMMKSKSI
jgi:hypothetical protein